MTLNLRKFECIQSIPKKKKREKKNIMNLSEDEKNMHFDACLRIDHRAKLSLALPHRLEIFI